MSPGKRKTNDEILIAFYKRMEENEKRHLKYIELVLKNINTTLDGRTSYKS